MKAAISFSLVILQDACLSVVPAIAQEKGASPPERVKLVRQMYENVPPLIFEVAEPVTVVKATLWEDGGSISVELKDARGKKFSMFLNRRIGSPTRETMYVSSIPYSSTPVLLRGPEEAALYGILLRWKATKDTPVWTSESVRAMLDHLDQRFAAVAPAKKNDAEKK